MTEPGNMVKVTAALLDDLRALVPGQVYRIRGTDGREYAILDWEDFVHIAENAGMHAIKPSKS